MNINLKQVLLFILGVIILFFVANIFIYVVLFILICYFIYQIYKFIKPYFKKINTKLHKPNKNSKGKVIIEAKYKEK